MIVDVGRREALLACAEGAGSMWRERCWKSVCDTFRQSCRPRDTCSTPVCATFGESRRLRLCVFANVTAIAYRLSDRGLNV